MDERLVVEPGKHRVNSTGLKIISCDDGLGAVAFVVEGYAEIMAAAPELLKQLKTLTREADASLDFRPEFREAIANANQLIVSLNGAV